ncbi:hypothetical protein AB0D87_38695 [Streptomyces sp. NPDC048342]|uniref:hypothetical protein n=1 Tax=unclassified Streptomyces TaxID=2593676 RepID=UPI00343EF9B2
MFSSYHRTKGGAALLGVRAAGEVGPFGPYGAMGDAGGMEIEILVVPDCPNGRPAAERLRLVLDCAGLGNTGLAIRVVADQAEAERLGFTGSPTILIDGRDPFAEPGRVPGLSCRVYRTPGGLAGVPTLDQLRQALRGAAR